MAKLIMTAEQIKDRNAWLEVRNSGLGGSDAGAIIGLNPYKKPYQLWLEKTGQIEQEDLSDNEAVYWCTVLDEAVANRFTEVTGKKVRKSGLLRSDEYLFMLASPDRMVVGENAGLEIKTANGFAAKKWEGDEVPDSYYCQCQHYMAVTGCEKWYIACLLGGQRFVWKTIDRNDTDIQALIMAEKEFWKHVTEQTAPPVDSSAIPYLETKYEKVKKGEPIVLPNDAHSLIAAYVALDANIKEWELKKNDIKAKLVDMLGENESGINGEYKVSWAERKGRETFDKKKFEADHPGMLKKYTTIGNPTRTFSIKGGN